MTTIAFVFPGQGSQAVGMLDAWEEQFACVRQTLAEASQALGFDLAGLIRNGPGDELNLTINTQPAMLTADVAIWRAWRESGGAEPAVLAGHSLGEYAALVAAGSLEFADAVRLVRQRAEFMQQAVAEGQGAMAAVVGLDDAAVADLCAAQAEGEVLEPVNFNAPGQVVVAGDKAAIERLLANAKAAGARMTRAIPVSVPAHSSLMRPAVQQLAAALRELPLQPPRIPVLHNVDAAPRETAASIAEALAAQVAAPVQWVRTLRGMQGQYGIDAGYEAGPGNVLCGLAKRSIKGIPFQPLATPEQMQQALQGDD